MHDEMLEQFDLDRDGLREADPRTALQVWLYYYALKRAGSVVAGYPPMAAIAVGEVGAGDDQVPEPEDVWEAFERICKIEGKKTNPLMQRGVITESVKIARREGNLFRWIRDEFLDVGVLEPIYGELLNVKGLGPKIVRFILRDTVWLWDLEEMVVAGEGHYLHPIDVWVRRVALMLWLDLQMSTDNTKISIRLADTCRTNGISHIRLNQGMWYWATRANQGDVETMRAKIDGMVEGSDCD